MAIISVIEIHRSPAKFSESSEGVAPTLGLFDCSNRRASSQWLQVEKRQTIGRETSLIETLERILEIHKMLR